MVTPTYQFQTNQRDRNHPRIQELIHEPLQRESVTELNRALGQELLQLDLAGDVTAIYWKLRGVRRAASSVLAIAHIDRCWCGQEATIVSPGLDDRIDGMVGRMSGRCDDMTLLLR